MILDPGGIPLQLAAFAEAYQPFLPVVKFTIAWPWVYHMWAGIQHMVFASYSAISSILSPLPSSGTTARAA